MSIRRAGKQPDGARGKPAATGSCIILDLEEALMLGILASAVLVPKARRKRTKNSAVRRSS